MTVKHLAALTLVVLAGCGGGGSASVAPAPAPATPQPIASVAPLTLVSTSFGLGGLPAAPASAARAPKFLGAGAKSVKVTLVTVNGGAPPTGLTTSVTTNFTPPCPCTVGGPAVPPGTDVFSVSVYDATAGAGNLIASATKSLTITAGIANANTITLLGVPASATIANVPQAVAGTALAATAITVTALDADANPITGPYATPFTVSSNDTANSLGYSLQLNGGTATQSITTSASTDVISLVYGGLAESTSQLSTFGGGITTSSVSVLPTASSITYTGPLNGAQPEVDLYTTSGTGSSGSLSLSQPGYSNAPYNRSFTAFPSAGCSSIATVSPTAGTSFTVTAIAAPTAGTCTIQFVNGASGQGKTVIVTYTASGIGVAGHRKN